VSHPTPSETIETGTVLSTTGTHCPFFKPREPLERLFQIPPPMRPAQPSINATCSLKRAAPGEELSRMAKPTTQVTPLQSPPVSPQVLESERCDVNTKPGKRQKTLSNLSPSEVTDHFGSIAKVQPSASNVSATSMASTNTLLKPTNNLPHKLNAQFANASVSVHPTRSPNAFILYRRALSPFLRAMFPNISNSETSKVLGKCWHQEDERVKQWYRELARGVKHANQELYTQVGLKET